MASLNVCLAAVGIPNTVWFGKDDGRCTLVMEKLGPSLADLLDLCGGRLSLKTVLMLADQMITRIESVHSRGYIHQDLNIDNFLVGVGPNKVLCYFGLFRTIRNIAVFVSFSTFYT